MNKVSLKRKKPSGLNCSFCGKDQNEVGKLISGPSVYICDECVEKCNKIIAEEPSFKEIPGAKDEPMAVCHIHGTIKANRKYLDRKLDEISGELAAGRVQHLFNGTISKDGSVFSEDTEKFEFQYAGED